MKDQTNIYRRDALRKIVKSALAASVAMSYGFQIQNLLAGDDGRPLILLYTSKYGATADTAGWIAEGINKSVTLTDLTKEYDAKSILAPDARFIIGSAVFKEGPMEVMLEFLQTHREKLDGNIFASFVVCGTKPDSDMNKKRIAGYLEKLNAPFSRKPPLSRRFGGRLIVDKLDAQDREALTNFYEKMFKKPLTDWDLTDPQEARNFAQLLINSMRSQSTLGRDTTRIIT